MRNWIELDVTDVITEGGVKAERNPRDEPVGYGVDHSHVLVFQGDVRIIGANYISWVADKDPVIDRVIFYSVRAVIRVELDLGDDVEWTLLIHDVDDASSDVTDNDLANILSDYNASSLRNVDETDSLIQLGIDDNDIPIGRHIEIGFV